MPIRMVDDPDDQYDNSNEDKGGGGGGGRGGGGLIQFLPLILGLLIRKPALLIVVLIAGAFFYFKGGCNMAGFQQQGSGEFSTGGNLDPREFAKASIYEGLDPAKTNLPEAVSLLKFAPNRLNQGEQGSCVAWSGAYGARTILEASSTGINPNQIAFSPSFMYNQIGLDGCQGSYIIRAMENMTGVGAVPLSQFPYDDRDCSRQPSSQLMQQASQYKMLGFTRLTDGDRVSALDLHAIKEHLAKDVPVVIGMMVGGSFMQGMMGQEVWHPTDDDYNQIGFGGHAMCVIGYDDRKEGGAFQIMNSWGPEWGQNGIGWVRYSDFKSFVREAYGVNRMPKRGAAAAKDLDISIGLVEKSGNRYIPLQLKSGNTFVTKSAIAKGTQFKMEVKNSVECYVYVLGMETDGSSYVLFPYPSKQNPAKTNFSPYCGLTGYRLFPRGASMQADDIGNKDFISVIVSKEPLDVFQLNGAVNQNRSAGFPLAVAAAVRSQSISGVKFSTTADGTMTFKTSAGDKNAVACIVEIDKQ
ncbi:C1 family peptidase [Foetidibacter luteolus]|uniref:C1 family peptidase n=1 Tax=Foetidibacter luteolus TaxID=2608880 RepID=UPI00129B30DE|nr:C1 family peptidase [Foetidibacter luteolus]